MGLRPLIERIIIEKCLLIHVIFIVVFYFSLTNLELFIPFVLLGVGNLHFSYLSVPSSIFYRAGLTEIKFVSSMKCFSFSFHYD